MNTQDVLFITLDAFGVVSDPVLGLGASSRRLRRTSLRPSRPTPGSVVPIAELPAARRPIRRCRFIVAPARKRGRPAWCGHRAGLLPESDGQRANAAACILIATDPIPGVPAVPEPIQRAAEVGVAAQWPAAGLATASSRRLALQQHQAEDCNARTGCPVPGGLRRAEDDRNGASDCLPAASCRAAC